MRFLPEMFPRLEHLSFSAVEHPRSQIHKILDPIVLFPVLRSFCFGVHQSVKNWENEVTEKRWILCH